MWIEMFVIGAMLYVNDMYLIKEVDNRVNVKLELAKKELANAREELAVDLVNIMSNDGYYIDRIFLDSAR